MQQMHVLGLYPLVDLDATRSRTPDPRDGASPCARGKILRRPQSSDVSPKVRVRRPLRRFLPWGSCVDRYGAAGDLLLIRAIAGHPAGPDGKASPRSPVRGGGPGRGS